jgi:hypothetical protein
MYRVIRSVLKASEEIKPKTLTYLENPSEFLRETEDIVSLMFPQFDFSLIRKAFEDIERLFDGKYPGYRGCNTRYHDLNHTMQCFLVTARLMHGAFINGIIFKENYVTLGLVSALMHDTGYIQSADDHTGTGGKYTLVHIERSVEFMERYFNKNDFSLRDYLFCRDCLKCTGVNVKIKEIQFESQEHEIVGEILGTADLIGQMADRNYLGKLTFLYQEFEEGGVSIYSSELDFLKATPDFWEFTQRRFATDYGNVDRYLRDHFRVLWGLDRDLLKEVIERNMNYLKFIVEYHGANYSRYLSGEGLKEVISEITKLEGAKGNGPSPVP